MDSDRDSPAVKALNEVMAVGSSQESSKGIPPGAEPALTSARTPKSTRTAIWKPTRTYWTRLVASTPRYVTQVARATNATQVTTLTRVLSPSAPTVSDPVISPSSR